MPKNRFGEFHLPAHNEFFDYFVEQWLENEEIPVVLWSCYHRRHRTNHAVESFYNKVNLERPHPIIKKKQKRSRKFQHENDVKFRGEKRRKCYIKPNLP
jgi:hypothetical protein